MSLGSTPREKSYLGDLYIREGNNKRLSYPSNISSFLEPHFEMPASTIDEIFGNNIPGVISNDIDTTIGFQFLEGFLNVLSMGILGTKIRVYFEQKSAQK